MKLVLGGAVVGCVAVATIAMIAALPVWVIAGAAFAVTVPPFPLLAVLVRRERRRYLELRVPPARLLRDGLYSD